MAKPAELLLSIVVTFVRYININININIRLFSFSVVRPDPNVAFHSLEMEFEQVELTHGTKIGNGWEGIGVQP